MDRLLPLRLGMNHSLRLLSALLLSALFVSPAFAQDDQTIDGATIASVDVSGLGGDRLSDGLRRDLQALKGTALDSDRLRELATRIEGEHPDRVAAVRSVVLADNVVQVVFLVGRISDNPHLAANINVRYVVEEVEVEGLAFERVSAGLRRDLDALEGRALDGAEADRIEERLATEFPDYEIDRRIARGSERGRIRLVFDFDRRDSSRWIPFASSRSKIVFHEHQGWSGAVDLPVAVHNQRFTLGLVFGNADDLVEEYSGFRFRLESLEVGTERVGLSLELSRLSASWRPQTLAALEADPLLPRPYDDRFTVGPAITFAPVPRLRVSAGLSVSELEPMDEAAAAGSQMASAVTASAAFDREWRAAGDASHGVDASYSIHAGRSALGSDLIYTRHAGDVRYRYEQRPSTLIVSAGFGNVSGAAPLFERFSLGDSSTLRGWNKYDITPAGADRIVFESVEYRYHAVAVFLDGGSIREPEGDSIFRYSTGFGIHTDHAFFTVGFPLNAAEVSATVMLGVRF
jgi:hypothetical protein